MVKYEWQRRQAIQTTMSLPNLGRPYAAWGRFIRLLRVQQQTAALDEMRINARTVTTQGTYIYIYKKRHNFHVIFGPNYVYILCIHR